MTHSQTLRDRVELGGLPPKPPGTKLVAARPRTHTCSEQPWPDASTPIIDKHSLALPPKQSSPGL